MEIFMDINTEDITFSKQICNLHLSICHTLLHLQTSISNLSLIKTVLPDRKIKDFFLK